MPILYPYIQYGGIWTTSQATDAVAAGTWAVPPTPKLFSWGYNAHGELGLSTSGAGANKSSPTQVGSLTNWSLISGGRMHVLSIKTDGTLWSWGQNNLGQLGTGNLTYYSSPKQIGSLTTWSTASAGYSHSLAVKTDGTLWAWGQGSTYGSLGLGNTTSYSSPKQVGSLTTWLTVAAGSYSSFAIKTDGSIWVWGGTLGRGVLGLGNNTYYSSPKQLGSLTNWASISARYINVLAVKTDGTLWSWGYNAQGQLGLGNTTDYSSPKQVGSLTNWSKPSTCFLSSLAVKTNNTLWAWGQGTYGELGLGNTTNYSSPKQVGLLTNWLSISSGAYNSSAIKTDGTQWSWGYNSYGQTGDGTTINFSSPKQVGSLTTWLSVSCGFYSTFGIAKT